MLSHGGINTHNGLEKYGTMGIVVQHSTVNTSLLKYRKSLHKR